MCRLLIDGQWCWMRSRLRRRRSHEGWRREWMGLVQWNHSEWDWLRSRLIIGYFQRNKLNRTYQEILQWVMREGRIQNRVRQREEVEQIDFHPTKLTRTNPSESIKMSLGLKARKNLTDSFRLLVIFSCSLFASTARSNNSFCLATSSGETYHFFLSYFWQWNNKFQIINNWTKRYLPQLWN